MSFIVNFVGFHDLHPQTRKLMTRFGLFQTANAALYALTGVIFVLFIIDKVGFLKTSQYLAIMVLVQLLIDYPSGTLGDYIGQRWVLFAANVSSSIALLVFLYAPSYSIFLISAILFGFSNAQASGALQPFS